MIKLNGARPIKKKPAQTTGQRFRRDQQEISTSPLPTPPKQAAKPAAKPSGAPITNRATTPRPPASNIAARANNPMATASKGAKAAAQDAILGRPQHTPPTPPTVPSTPPKAPAQNDARGAAIDAILGGQAGPAEQVTKTGQMAAPDHRNDLPDLANIPGATGGPSRTSIYTEPGPSAAELPGDGRTYDGPRDGLIERILGGGEQTGFSPNLPTTGPAGPVPTGGPATPAPGAGRVGPATQPPLVDERPGSPGVQHPGSPDSRDIAQRLEDWALENVGQSRDIGAEEALIREQMANQAGQGLVDQRARAGARGLGDSGAMISMESDLRRQNALATSGALLGNQRDARDEELNRTLAAAGVMRGERGLSLEETKFDMLMDMLGQLAGEDAQQSAGSNVLMEDESGNRYIGGADGETYQAGPMNGGDPYTRGDPRFGGVTPIVASQLPPGSKPVQNRTDGTIFEGPDGRRYWVPG